MYIPRHESNSTIFITYLEETRRAHVVDSILIPSITVSVPIGRLADLQLGHVTMSCDTAGCRGGGVLMIPHHHFVAFEIRRSLYKYNIGTRATSTVVLRI